MRGSRISLSWGGGARRGGGGGGGPPPPRADEVQHRTIYTPLYTKPNPNCNRDFVSIEYRSSNDQPSTVH